MKKIAISLFLLIMNFDLSAQGKTYEFSNPDFIELTIHQNSLLTNNSWKVMTIENFVKNEKISTKGWAFLEFFPDNTFKYGGVKGKWELIENKYFKFEIEDHINSSKINFGGIYVVESLTNSTLVLSKTLTSTNDWMKKIHLRILNYYKEDMLADKQYYKGPVNNVFLDSISLLSEELLLKISSPEMFLAGDTIFVKTEDKIYKLKRNSTKK